MDALHVLPAIFSLYMPQPDYFVYDIFPFKFLGCDAAFIGPSENQFAILDEDKSGLALYILPGLALEEVDGKNGAVEPNLLPDQPVDAKANSIQGPVSFMFETEVDRIFSTPIGAWGHMILHIGYYHL